MSIEIGLTSVAAISVLLAMPGRTVTLVVARTLRRGL